jgi:hypothetical protein
MTDITDCYVIVFTDDIGTVHAVPFEKKGGGNKRANALLKTLKEIGLPSEKYGRYSRPS